MKRKILPILIFLIILTSIQAQSVFDITCTTSNIGCAPYRAVFHNNSIGVDSIFILCEITPSEINNYGDSIEIIYNEGFTWDMDFFVQFEGYTSNGAFIDYASFPIRVYYSTTPPVLSKDTFCTGETIYIADPSIGNFNDLIVDFGDGTVENPFDLAVHAYSQPGAYTIQASWATQCTPSSASIPIIVKTCSNNSDPVILFSFKDTVCPGVQDTFSVNSNIELLSTYFDYGQGLTTMNTHVFDRPGKYPVKAIVTDMDDNETILADTAVVLGSTNENLAEVTPLVAPVGKTITFNALGNYTYLEWVIKLPKHRWKGNTEDMDSWISPLNWKKGYLVIKDLAYFQKEFKKCGFYQITFKHNTCGIQQSETKRLKIYPTGIMEFADLKSVDSDNLNQNQVGSDLQLGNNETMTIYPNPVVDICYIKLPDWAVGKINVSVFNSLGQTVATYSFEEVLANEVSINLNDLKSGTYFLKFESNNYHQILKFIKQ